MTTSPTRDAISTRQGGNDATDRLADRMREAGVASLEIVNVYIGLSFGLYRRLASEPHTVGTLAAAAGCDERYIQEWLQAQIVSGYVTADGPDLPEATVTLAPGAREVLVDELSPVYLAPLSRCFGAISNVLPRLVSAFRTGDGIPYTSYGIDAVAAQGALNRPIYANELVRHWLPALPDVAARLADTDQPTLVADMGCGVGWSAIELAKAYPEITIDGYDADERSIALARTNAADQGVGGRVNFAVAPLSQLVPRYNLVMMLEVLHDFGDADGTLRVVRDQMAPDSTLLVMEERTDDQLIGGSASVYQRYFANVSPLWCLPQALVEPGAHPIGTVIRAETVRRLLDAAGFHDIADVPIDHPTFRFIRASR